MKLLATTISFLILGSLAAQREQPEVRTLDSKFLKSTKNYSAGVSNVVLEKKYFSLGRKGVSRRL